MHKHTTIWALRNTWKVGQKKVGAYLKQNGVPIYMSKGRRSKVYLKDIKNLKPPRARVYYEDDPNEEQIAYRCRMIREGWSERTRRERLVGVPAAQVFLETVVYHYDQGYGFEEVVA